MKKSTMLACAGVLAALSIATPLAGAEAGWYHPGWGWWGHPRPVVSFNFGVYAPAPYRVYPAYPVYPTYPVYPAYTYYAPPPPPPRVYRYAAVSSAHIAWCTTHYLGYSGETDTYVVNGLAYRCPAPY